jgi:hypothetical protein
MIYYHVEDYTLNPFLGENPPFTPSKVNSMRQSFRAHNLRERLPSWFRMRKDPESAGSRLLNTIGLMLDDAQTAIEYAYLSGFLQSADPDQEESIIYKGSIPSTVRNYDNMLVYGNGLPLAKTSSIEEFLTCLETDLLHNPEIYYDDPCYIDPLQRTVYVRRKYGPLDNDGEIIPQVTVLEEINGTTTEYAVPLTPHQVWNNFDEIGLKLDCPRLYLEPNSAYKERLLDVFRFRSNSSKTGLIRGMARDLGLVKALTWDCSQNLVLEDINVDPNSILVDGIFVTPIINDSGQIILPGDPEMAGVTKTVRYVHGVKPHSFFDSSDAEFQARIYNPDGTATSYLENLVEQISNAVPTGWGKFRWDEGFFIDTASIPSTLRTLTDASTRNL